MMFITYILHSETIKRYYVGHTEDLAERIKQHNTGEGKFTKRGIPWKLIWMVESSTRGNAILLENKIKKRGIERFLADNNIRGVAQPG